MARYENRITRIASIVKVKIEFKLLRLVKFGAIKITPIHPAARLVNNPDKNEILALL